MARTRHIIRRSVRCPFRRGSRSAVRTRWRAPNDLAQALIAFGRAIRAHRHLARLAPSFFDSAVVDREHENREATRRWMESWVPILAKAYGVPPEPVDLTDDLPRLPGQRTQLAVERRLAEWQLWMDVGRAAMARRQQRHPHALPSLPQLARLLKLAFDFKALALGTDSPNKLPDKINYDYEFTDLKRAYGRKMEPDLPPPDRGLSQSAVLPPATTNQSSSAGGDLELSPLLSPSYPRCQTPDPVPQISPDAKRQIQSPKPSQTPDARSNPPKPSQMPEPKTKTPSSCVSPPPPVSSAPTARPVRCDAWSRLARQLRRRAQSRKW